MSSFKKIGIIGVGLLGGSIGLAYKEKYPDSHILGMGRHESKLQLAKDLKAIDSYELNYPKGVSDCDLVIICTPVKLISTIFHQISGALKDNAIVTDVGSTKSEIEKEIFESRTGQKHFIGSHPMAGSEQTGVEAATADLYHNAMIVVTENNINNPHSVQKIEDFWKKLGGQTIRMTANDHDQLVAQTSHLPHLIASCIAYSLAENISQEEIQKRIFGNGLLDTTRIAEGDPKMWLDIFLTNQKNLLSSIKQFKESLSLIENMIQSYDFDGITDYLTKSKNFRAKLSS